MKKTDLFKNKAYKMKSAMPVSPLQNFTILQNRANELHIFTFWKFH